MARLVDLERCFPETCNCWLVGARPGKLVPMSQPLTANDLLPLVARLAPQERERLVRLMAVAAERDAAVYRDAPPHQGEFSSDDDALGWDADGWEKHE